jgi:hypothetical protein
MAIKFLSFCVMKDNNKGWGRPCCLRAVLECGVLCFGKALDYYL